MAWCSTEGEGARRTVLAIALVKKEIPLAEAEAKRIERGRAHQRPTRRAALGAASAIVAGFSAPERVGARRGARVEPRAGLGGNLSIAEPEECPLNVEECGGGGRRRRASDVLQLLALEANPRVRLACQPRCELPRWKGPSRAGSPVPRRARGWGRGGVWSAAGRGGERRVGASRRHLV